jgi:hypothetical protein
MQYVAVSLSCDIIAHTHCVTEDTSVGSQLAFLTPPFLGGISAEVCETSPHNSDFL